MTLPSAELLLSHAEFLRGLARSLLRDEQAAEDVAQEAMVAAIERPPAHANLRAWLARVTRNLAVSSHRSRQRRALRERLAARPEGVPSVSDDVARLELQRRVVEAVLALEERYRRVVVLRYFDGLPIKGIARRLDVPVETVRTRLRRAHDQLRVTLDHAHGGDREAWALGLFSLAWPKHAATAAGGIALMGLKAKLILALALLAALFFVGRSVWTEQEPPERVAQAPTLPDPIAPEEQVEAPAPESIDFDALDRDRDLHGTVLNEKGESIADATVTIVRRPGRKHDLSTIALEEVESAPVRITPDGRFSVRLERGEIVDLKVSAPGYAPLRLPWRLAGGRETVTLREGRELRVRVVDSQGGPVEGARIEYWLPPRIQPHFASGVVMIPEQFTDEEGRCAWEAIHAADDYSLFVRHPDYWIGQARVPADWEGEIEVVLQPGSRVRGRVLDRETSEPISGAVVSTTPLAWPKFVRSDDEGRYRIGGVGALKKGGRAALFAWADGYRVARADATEGGEIDFALVKGIELFGRLIDDEGFPVGDATVTALGGSDQLDLDSRSTRSDAEGRFELGGLRPGIDHTLIMTKPGFARLLQDSGPRTEARIDLGEIRLGRGFALEGRVLDGSGEPVACAVVICKPVGSKRDRPEEERCLTDDLGRFRFRVTGPANWKLTAELADRSSFAREIQVDADRFDVELGAGDVHRLTVRVQEANGAPVAGARVIVWQSDARTDESGIVQFEVPAEKAKGWVAVMAREKGYIDVTLRDQRYDQGEMTVVIEKGKLLRGRLLDRDGRGIDDVSVSARWEARGSTSAETHGEGRFELLVPPDLNVDLRNSDWRGDKPNQVEIREIRVSPEENDIEIRTIAVRYDREVVILITDPDGAPLAGQVVHCSAVSREPLGTSGADGRVNLKGLPARELVIQVLESNELDPDWATPYPAKVLPGGQEVVMAFRKTVSITGRVILPEGATGLVGLLAFRDELVAHAVTKPDGSFRLKIGVDDLSPLRIQVMPPEHVDPDYKGPKLAPAELENVKPGATGVEIVLERAE